VCLETPLIEPDTNTDGAAELSHGNKGTWNFFTKGFPSGSGTCASRGYNSLATTCMFTGQQHFTSSFESKGNVTNNKGMVPAVIVAFLTKTEEYIASVMEAENAATDRQTILTDVGALHNLWIKKPAAPLPNGLGRPLMAIHGVPDCSKPPSSADNAAKLAYVEYCYGPAGCKSNGKNIDCTEEGMKDRLLAWTAAQGAAGAISAAEAETLEVEDEEGKLTSLDQGATETVSRRLLGSHGSSPAPPTTMYQYAGAGSTVCAQFTVPQPSQDTINEYNGKGNSVGIGRCADHGFWTYLNTTSTWWTHTYGNGASAWRKDVEDIEEGDTSVLQGWGGVLKFTSGPAKGTDYSIWVRSSQCNSMVSYSPNKYSMGSGFTDSAPAPPPTGTPSPTVSCAAIRTKEEQEEAAALAAATVAKGEAVKAEDALDAPYSDELKELASELTSDVSSGDVAALPALVTDEADDVEVAKVMAVEESASLSALYDAYAADAKSDAADASADDLSTAAGTIPSELSTLSTEISSDLSNEDLAPLGGLWKDVGADEKTEKTHASFCTKEVPTLKILIADDPALKALYEKTWPYCNFD